MSEKKLTKYDWIFWIATIGLVSASVILFFAWMGLEETKKSVFQLFSVGTPVFGLWLVFYQLRENGRKYAIELMPFLTVEIIQNGRIEWDGTRLLSEGQPISEVWFEIHNAGKSPVTVEAIYRRWATCLQNDYPEPLQPGGCEKANSSIANGDKKACAIPVAGCGRSSKIRTRAHRLEKLNPVNPNSHRICFDGFIEAKTPAGDTFVSGFSLTLNDGQFHIGWPLATPEKHNYQPTL